MKESILHALRLAQKNAAAIYEKRLPPGCSLTLPQSEVLLTLLRNGPSSQTAIVELTCIDRSTLGVMLPRLIRDGFAASVIDVSDNRANLVSITPKGRSCLGDALNAMDATENFLMKHTPGGKRKLMVSLKSIADVSDV